MKYGAESDVSDLSARLRESLGTSQAPSQEPAKRRPLSAAAPSFSSSLPAALSSSYPSTQGTLWGPPAASDAPTGLGFDGAVRGSAAAFLKSPGAPAKLLQLLSTAAGSQRAQPAARLANRVLGSQGPGCGSCELHSLRRPRHA